MNHGCRNLFGVVAAASALATLVTASGCVGVGRNRADEFDTRVTARLGGDEQHWADRTSREEADRREAQAARLERSSKERGGPQISDGPLANLERLHARLASKDVSGHALIWEDSRLFSSPSMEGRSALGRLGYRPDHWRASGGHVIPVRVVADHGRAIQIETLSRAEAEDHCDGGVRRLLDAYHLTMVVPRSELVPVVAAEFDHDYSDGSIVFVPPGVALRATGRGLMARLAGGEIEVPMPSGLELIGLSYQRAGFPDGRISPEPMQGRLSASEPLRVAGQAIQHRLLSEEAQRPRWVRESGDGSRLFLADRCAAIIAVTEDPRPFEPSDDDIMLGRPTKDEGQGHSYRIRAGAPVWWENGDEAGTVRSLARHHQEPETRRGRLCFPLMGVVKVCHDPQDVEMMDRLRLEG